MINVSSSKTNVNTPKEGDIVVALYGFEATIESFGVIVKVSPKRVSIQEIGSNRVYTGGGGMNWTATPNKEVVKGVVSRSWKDWGDGYTVKNNSYSSYSKWSGQPLECYNHH